MLAIALMVRCRSPTGNGLELEFHDIKEAYCLRRTDVNAARCYGSHPVVFEGIRFTGGDDQPSSEQRLSGRRMDLNASINGTAFVDAHVIEIAGDAVEVMKADRQPGPFLPIT